MNRFFYIFILRINLITIKITFVEPTHSHTCFLQVKRENLIIIALYLSLCIYHSVLYRCAVLQYFNAIINVNRMLICIPSTREHDFRSASGSQIWLAIKYYFLFALQLNQIIWLSEAKTCFSFRRASHSHHVPTEWTTVLKCVIFYGAVIYILLHDTHSSIRVTWSALKRIRTNKTPHSTHKCHFQWVKYSSTIIIWAKPLFSQLYTCWSMHNLKYVRRDPNSFL